MGVIGTADESPAATLRRVHGRNIFRWQCDDEIPQQHVCTEEAVRQQLCIQERNSSLDQEDPEPPQIKDEQEELCTSQEGEQLVLKQETDFLKSSPTYERSDHKKDWTLRLDPDQNQRAADNKPPDNISPKRTISESDRGTSGGPESNSDNQLLFDISHVADNQDHKSGNCGNATKPRKKHKGTSKSTRNRKRKLKKEQNDQEHKVSSTYSQSKPTDKSFKCHSCSKNFDLYTRLKVHMSTHAAERPFSCTVCGKGFTLKRYLKQHMITHSSEKPYSCNMCWKSFRRFEHLQIHMRSHTGERPYSCVYCDRAFSTSSALTKHVRLHSVGKPYDCSFSCKNKTKRDLRRSK